MRINHIGRTNFGMGWAKDSLKNLNQVRNEIVAWCSSPELSSVEKTELINNYKILDFITPPHDVIGTLGTPELPATLCFIPKNDKAKYGCITQGQIYNYSNDSIKEKHPRSLENGNGSFQRSSNICDPNKFLVAAIKFTNKINPNINTTKLTEEDILRILDA